MDLNFDDITPRTVPFTVAGKRYTLHEPSAEAYCRYRSALQKGTRFSADGKQAVVEGNAEAELLLLSLCLTETYEHRGQTLERPVPLLTTKGWPARVHKALFAEAEKLLPKDTAETPADMERQVADLQRRLEGMRNGEHAEKNSPAATTAT